MRVLVTGFGPFPGVEHNPSAALAQAVDGARVGTAVVTARVLPVAWQRGPQLAIREARALPADLVIGLGVAVGRPTPDVECVAVRACNGHPDAFGARLDALDGPDEVPATVDVRRLAGALGAGLSWDAGRYVCNAWLFQVASALTVPVGFVHIPQHGLEPEALLRGIGALCYDGPAEIA